jgi:hypothetical protein
MPKILSPTPNAPMAIVGRTPWSAGDPLVANAALDLLRHGTSASSFGPVSSPIPHDRAQIARRIHDVSPEAPRRHPDHGLGGRIACAS